MKTYAEPAEPVLQAAVGVADHQRVEPGAGHDREALAVDDPDVEASDASRANPMRTASSRSCGMPRFDANRFAVPAGRIARVTGASADRVDAALHHAVAAPDEEQVGAVFEELRHFLRRQLALRDLAPERSVDAVLFQRVPQRAQAAAELLPGMRDHADGGHQAASSAAARRSRSTVPSRSSDTATALLVASSANSNAPHPSSTLARTSVR